MINTAQKRRKSISIVGNARAFDENKYCS